MTVQVGTDIVTFNGEEPPIGALLGAFLMMLVNYNAQVISHGQEIN